MQLPGAVVSAIIVLLLFPSGRPEYRYSRLAVALALSGFLLLAISTALRPEGLLWYPTLPNPLGTPSSIRPLVAAGMVLGATALVSSLVLAALWLAGRFRSAHSVERRHLAWVAFGAVTMTVTVALLFVARYVGPVDDPVGERLMLVAAIGAVIFPITLFRFVSATASEGIEMDDLTFLFTDLQDSTLMYERVGDATAYDLVRVHFRVLEGATREQGGVIVKTIGDAIMARFLEPTQAVHTALHMQERIDALAKDGRRRPRPPHRHPSRTGDRRRQPRSRRLLRPDGQRGLPDPGGRRSGRDRAQRRRLPRRRRGRAARGLPRSSPSGSSCAASPARCSCTGSRARLARPARCPSGPT